MIRDSSGALPDANPWKSALGAVLLFGYGAVVVGFIFRIGGLSDTELVAALQTTTLPLLYVAARATYRERATAVPVAVSLVVFGAGVRLGTTVGTSTGFGDGVLAGALVTLTLAGFATSWAVIGYIVGTAWRWHRNRERIGQRALLYSCTPVLVGGAAAFVSYALFWTYFVIGVGDGAL